MLVRFWGFERVLVFVSSCFEFALFSLFKELLFVCLSVCVHLPVTQQKYIDVKYLHGAHRSLVRILFP